MTGIPARRVAAALALLLAFSLAAHAQSSLGIGNAEVGGNPSSGGVLAPVFAEILRVQRLFFTELREALVAVRGEGLGVGGLWLVALAFGYGVFHAAGPGHGKAVISAYVLANERELRRGVALSFAAAAVQALAALVVVALGWFALRGTAWRMTDLATLLEQLSYAGIALLGLALLARAAMRLGRVPAAGVLRALRGRIERPGASGLAFAGRGTFSDAAGAAAFPLPRASRSLPADAVCERDAELCGCGASHLVDPRAASAGWRTGLATVLAVGLRPCSGAIVVLTFALVNGLWMAGLLAVAAMALGTAITVSAIAALAVAGKGGALRLVSDGRRLARLRVALEAGGALVLVVLGLGLLRASL